MKTRIITGVIAALFMVAMLILLPTFPPILNIIIAFVCAIAAFEITDAAKIRHNILFVMASMGTAAAIPLVLISAQGFFWCKIIVVVYILAMFAIQLKVHNTVPMVDMLTAMAITVLVPLSMNHLIQVYYMGGQHGLFYLLMLLFSAWGSDIGAYFIGVRFGKHKLCPQISPKKTVEGFLGGIFGSVILMEAAAALYCLVIFPDTTFSVLAVAVLAAFCAVISVLGDLSFSLIKRHYGIKDYGNIMPGHGGVLDRFDSVIFVAPVFALILQFLPIVHA